MPARRRKRNVAVNTKLIIDVLSASVIVQKAPALLSSFVQLDPTISKVAGAGVGYLTGVMLKRPDISNASIALAIVDFVSPMIDDLIGGFGVEQLSPVVTSNVNALPPAIEKRGAVPRSVDDFVTLNDYITNPSIRMPAMAYRDSY